MSTIVLPGQGFSLQAAAGCPFAGLWLEWESSDCAVTPIGRLVLTLAEHYN